MCASYAPLSRLPAMVPETTQPLWQRMLIGVGGPAVAGTCAGSLYGVDGLLAFGALTPLSFLGITFITLPGFYIGTALLNIAPEPREVSRVALGALHDQGVAYLGLSPALLFLCATSTNLYEGTVIGMVGLGLGALVGVSAFYRRLRKTMAEPKALFLIFTLWFLLCAGLSWELYLKILTFAGGLS